MKKNLFYLFALICSMSLFTACSDDDDPDYSQVIDSEIAGDYKGTLDISLDGTDIAAGLPKNVSVSKAGNAAIDLLLADFNLLGMELGDIKLEKCRLSQSGNAYSFKGNQMLNIAQYSLEADVQATGVIEGGDMTVQLDIAAKLNGLSQDVKVTYKGAKLTGDESTEAKITSFTFDLSNEANSVVIEQPVINSDNTITFRVDEDAVKEDASALTKLVPTFAVSDKATASVESGKAMDFSKDITITVVAESGDIVEYVVKTPAKNSLMKFSFDEWVTVGTGKAQHEEPEPKDMLASSVEGASLLFLFGVEGFPVYKSADDKVAGDAAIQLITMDTSAKTSSLVPALTAGSVFTGSFNMAHAMTDRMKCTEFGISYARKPLSFRGWYKYTAGEKFINGEGAKKPEEVTVEEGKTDECSIAAVLYEAEKDEEGNNIPLTGHDINTSSRRVAVAALADGTNKSEWTSFNLEFQYLDGKTYDSTKEYYLAIVCSSSKEGDSFKGAGGSTLMLDEFEIIGE